MIKFTCDRCHQEIDSETELRFVVSIELEAVMDSKDDRRDDEYLEELNELLSNLDSVDCVEISQQAYQKQTYDLCERCREAFLKNPLSAEHAAALGFSNN